MDTALSTADRIAGGIIDQLSPTKELLTRLLAGEHFPECPPWFTIVDESGKIENVPIQVVQEYARLLSAKLQELGITKQSLDVTAHFNGSFAGRLSSTGCPVAGQLTWLPLPEETVSTLLYSITELE